ncbi:3350_t:CDS:2 [Entrophospora sp. SA101]|nr:3350_t:CDS:2 [Entrophospora sp. SA101]
MGFFDEPILLLSYEGWIFGLATMVHLHNLIVSIFLYKSRQTNISNICKIMFNFGGILVFICNFWNIVVPLDVTLDECRGVSYTLALANITYKSSLAAFLLWRLRQIESKNLDYWLGIGLFFSRFGFHFAQIFQIKPEVRFDEGENASYCIQGIDIAKIPLMGAIIFDLIIDFYVTIRLIQILSRANKNASQITSNITRKTKRSLFTAVMYWNFIRLILAASFNALLLFYTVLGFYRDQVPTISATSLTLQAILGILLSYALTADAEIVRVIEGKNNVNGSSINPAGTGKSFKNMPQTPKSTSSHYQTSSEPPKYSTGNYSFSKNEKPESNDIGDNKIAVVSMKRLSFFEWANVIVGNKLVKKDNDIADEESGIEIVEENGIEIVEENPEVAGNHSRNIV